MSDPLERPALARSRDEEDPGVGRGPVLARAQTLSCTAPAVAWLAARHINQRGKPGIISPLSRAASTFIAERTCRLPPRQRATRPPSIKCVLSNPMAGDVRVIQQAARLTGQLGNSAPVPSGAPYSSSLLQEVSPARQGYADLRCQSARRSPQQHTFVAPSAIFVKPLGPHVGAQYLCACPLRL